ncbi:hypothetical protein JHK87_055225 [Glycine soja]|nr:hypothetical protein JHK87_055225 [Glycine soja]
MTFPPKGLSLCTVSFKLLSSTSKLNFTGIANLECVVLPSGSSNEAIPLEATVKTIPQLDCIIDDKIFQINVFPVPPYPQRK